MQPKYLKIVFIIIFICLSNKLIEAQYFELWAGNHSNSINSVAFSPDGKKVVSGSLDNSVKLWNSETGELQWAGYHTDNVYSVDFSPLGNKVVSGSLDKTLKVWNSQNGALLWTGNHSEYVSEVIFSPSGNTILSSSGDNTIKLWNAETGAIIWTGLHSNNVNSIAFSPSGNKVASGSLDNTLKVWSVLNGTLLWTGIHSGEISTIDFSPDDTKILSGIFDQNLKLWNAETGGLLWTGSHTNYISSVKFSPDGKKIVSGSGDKKVKLWDVQTGGLLWTGDHSEYITSVSFSPDSHKLLSGSGDATLKVWGVETGTVLWTGNHSRDILAVAFSPDGQSIVSGSNDNSIKMWEELTDYVFLPSKSYINFGSVSFEHERSQKITIDNIGDLNNSINNISVSSKNFDFSIDTSYVISGKSTELTIHFKPIEYGNLNGVLSFTDYGQNVYNIYLSGRSVVPLFKLHDFFTEVAEPSYVNVLFQITDLKGNGIPGLGETEYYEILVDSNQISESEALPAIGKLDEIPFRVNTILMLDNSFSIGSDLPKLKKAAIDFVNSKFAEQLIALYTFSENISLLHSFKSNKQLLINAINSITLGQPSTDLYGAVIEGLNRLQNKFSRTEIETGYLLVFTDGEDTQGSSTLDEVITAREDKLVYSVGVGDEIDIPTLYQIQNAGFFVEDDYSELQDRFLEVQQKIEDDANSFYWLLFISPKRGDFDHSLTIRLKDNLFLGENSIIDTSFNSKDFYSVQPGVYLNKSFANPNGITSLEMNSNNILLTASTLFGLFEPEYRWASANETKLQITNTNDKNTVKITNIANDGSLIAVRVDDITNSFFKQIVVKLPTIVSLKETHVPSDYQLFQNYPNPFNPTTTIKVNLPVHSSVAITIYDILGRVVSSVANKEFNAGQYEFNFDASKLSSGIYFCTMRTKKFQKSIKMLLLK